MANRLKMAKIQAILELHQRGWSQRRIAHELGIDRETVSRYVGLAADESNPAISPAGKSVSGPEPNPTVSPLGSERDELPAGIVAFLQRPRSVGRKSCCEPFRDVILAKFGQDLSGQQIYQDLITDHGYAGSYDSVKRFVRRLGVGKPLPMRRMECAPGTEAQVDFGSGAPIVGPDGKRRKTHVFRIVLSHSRRRTAKSCFGRRRTTSCAAWSTRFTRSAACRKHW